MNILKETRLESCSWESLKASISLVRKESTSKLKMVTNLTSELVEDTCMPVNLLNCTPSTRLAKLKGKTYLTNLKIKWTFSVLQQIFRLALWSVSLSEAALFHKVLAKKTCWDHWEVLNWESSRRTDAKGANINRWISSWKTWDLQRMTLGTKAKCCLKILNPKWKTIEFCIRTNFHL